MSREFALRRSASSVLTRSVTNPNWFDADFKRIQAVVTADGYDLELGKGVRNNAKFQRYALSQFTFPVNMK